MHNVMSVSDTISDGGRNLGKFYIERALVHHPRLCEHMPIVIAYIRLNIITNLFETLKDMTEPNLCLPEVWGLTDKLFGILIAR